MAGVASLINAYWYDEKEYNKTWNFDWKEWT